MVGAPEKEECGYGCFDEGMPYKVAGGFISKSQTLLAAVLHLLIVETSAEH